MVAGGGHRHGGAAAERGEGRGKRNGRSTAHPGSTTTTGTATGAEEGGGTARVDGDGGVPAVGGRNGGVDEVGEDAAEPKEATPRREKDVTKEAGLGWDWGRTAVAWPARAQSADRLEVGDTTDRWAPPVSLLVREGRAAAGWAGSADFGPAWPRGKKKCWAKIGPTT
uniref:Pr1-like protein n=1 Tax=Oryza sativa subsp. japonica TaxID=39947 RepID=Q67TL0_ORYSJ|nr:pr1-like protein [Oryza sativa Japonica Group]